MIEEDDVNLADRLELMDGEKPKPRRRRDGPTLGRALAPLLVLAAIGGALYVAANAERGAEEELATAEPDDWQGTGTGFEAMPTPPAAASAAPAIQAETPAPIPAAAAPALPPALPFGPSETERALLERLATMEAQLDALREGAASEGRDEGAQARIDALSDQLDALADETEALREEADDANRQARARGAEVTDLQGQLAAARAELEAAQIEEPAATGGEAAPTADPTEAVRLAELEERRAAAAAEREARISSPIIAFGGSVAPAEPGPAAGAPDLGQNEAFLRQGGRQADVEQASVIANPSRTVVQGTVIQAAMETAIDSSLPGAIRAVVSEDVHSFDGTRVLIPRGSRLIGRYNSQVEPTQRRILIAWDRIITPDGQSVTIAAFGADELGRSGTTGVIDRRLGTRFGTAALVSLISAGPRLAAAALDDPFAADLAVDLGDDAEDAAGSALEPYLNVPPTITVDQGARITVMVDRDLEML